ncbi:MAG: nitrate reductase associated protein [Pseudanabaenaceae cyanobacterium SKYGB_i_bin29]|nr:nitrate reductase associated protein [Pseudanabaenaceae cyanobacterium SKYG29]MDW8421856.1 nitrate reductase associated protein [Pseudanabaenaceae cyanobacterium SKYGB_i_bin29]
MAPYFQFETDFVTTLHCIPMIVRYKLDLCGIKLKLQHWQKLNRAQKEWLVFTPCDNPEARHNYRTQLQTWVIELTGTPPAALPIPDPLPWEEDTIPEVVIAQLQKLGQPVFSAAQWQQLSSLQRFALIKLSQPNHENRNFLPALREFNLLSQVNS